MTTHRLRNTVWFGALLIAAAAAVVAVVFIAAPRPAPPHAGAMCGDPAEPLLLFGDFNADGVVDARDVAEIREVARAPRTYLALYDRNADGVVDGRDVALVEAELGFASTTYDREIARAYRRFAAFQEVRDASALRPEFRPLTEAIAGHGQHWSTEEGSAAARGEAPPSFNRAQGLNIPEDQSGVWAMFWNQAAIPVFEGGATDWPTPGGAWQDQHVIAFADTPPKFTSDFREIWHTHAGLCLFENLAGEREIHVHTTYNECQTYASATPGDNQWINIWMVHLWLFELNPNGVWGGTHPCLDQQAPTEAEFAEGREIPMFFRGH
jgi:hypothetical protein